MRRKTDREIVKENIWLVFLPGALILLGILIGLWPYLFPEPDYDALEEREVTVQALRHFSGVKGVSYDYIVTTDGERLHLSGDYDREKISAQLTQGQKATIKWCVNRPSRRLLAEEVRVDGETVVAYRRQPDSWKPMLVFGSWFVATGIGGFLLLRLLVKTNRRKQNQRDEKIRRKYGRQGDGK